MDANTSFYINVFCRDMYHLSANLGTLIPELKPIKTRFIHYCSLGAFYAIVESGKIRFTSSRSTNDPSESIYGEQIVGAALKTFAKKLPEPEQIYMADRGKYRSDFNAFVFCMTEATEEEEQVGELSQWRLYGADGKGVALVFDVSWPEQNIEMLCSLAGWPRKVVYGEATGTALVHAVLDRFFSGVREMSDEHRQCIKREFGAFRSYVNNSIFWLPSVIKHPAYKHEREVRLICSGPNKDPVTFFERGGIKRPAIDRPIAYLPTESPDQLHFTPIRRVIIGPSGDQPAIHDSVEHFLRVHRWLLDIRRSDIPYRAL
jgi:hypothetical protein